MGRALIRTTGSAVLALAVVGVVACSGVANEADARARAFVDAYYLRFDLDAALPYTEGIARARLEEHKRLVDAARAQAQVEPAKSRIYYATPERRDAGPDRAHFTFELEVHSGDTVSSQTVVVLMGRRQTEWKVVSFREVRPEYPEVPGDPGNPRRVGVRTSSGTATATAAPPRTAP